MAAVLQQANIDRLFSFTEVSVIQTIDAAALQALLSQLLQGHATADAQIKAQQQEIAALKQRQHELEQVQQQRTAQQVIEPDRAGNAALLATATGTGSSTPASTSDTPIQALLHELDRRLSKLEASWPSSQPVEAGNRAVAAQPAKPASAAPAAVAPVQALVPVAPAPAAPASNAIQAAPPQQHQDCAAGIQELQRQHALLASQLAALKDVLAATTGDVHQQLAGLANNKADAGQLAVLADALSGKADSRDLEQTKKQLAGKADRDELDALLNSLAAAGSTEADGGPAVTALGASGAADWDKKLQLQLTLLQERIAKKADASAVDAAADGLAAARQDIARLQLASQQASSQLAAAHKAIEDTRSSFAAQREQKVQPVDKQQLQHGTMQHAPAAGSAELNSDMISQIEQLPLVLLRLSAVEGSLAAAAAAAVPAQPQRDTTVALPSSGTSKNGSNGGSSQPRNSSSGGSHSAELRELVAQVAQLQLQVTQLVRHSSLRSSSKTPDADAHPPESASPTGFRVTAAHAEDSGSTDGDAAAGEEESAPAAAATAAWATIAGQAEGLEAVAALAGLSARVAELQQQLDSLAAAKADRGELDRLRGVLAETASQSDTQLLHHKLDSQQSHLTRLTQQLASLASATTGTKASGNSGVAAGYAEGRSPKGISRARTEAAGLATAEHSALVGATGTEAAVFGAADVTAAAEYDEVDKLDMDNLQEQLQQQLVGLEVLAEAVCLLATGQAAAAADLAGSPSPTAAEPGGHVNGPTNATTDTAGSFSFGRRAAAGSGGATGTAETKAAAVAGIGFLGAAASPQLSRLRRLLQTGQVGRKLDWFDPVLLQKMAQRLAAAEALIKMQAPGYPGAGPSDMEGRVKRLAADVKLLKDRLALAEAAAADGLASRPAAQGGWGIRDGDHTMLASKPLAGYRCMACDRPLGSLDASPGPFLPTGALPVTLPSGADLAAGPAGPAGARLPPAGSRRNTVQDALSGLAPPPPPSSSAAAAAAEFVLGGSSATSPEPGGGPPSRRVTGPQSWYAAAHGLPAEQLPKADVGPHLPPGGWRGSLPRAEDGSVLPSLVSRGGGAFGLGGSVPPGTAQGGRPAATG